MFLRKEAEELVKNGCNDPLLLRRALTASIEREKLASLDKATADLHALRAMETMTITFERVVVSAQHADQLSAIQHGWEKLGIGEPTLALKAGDVVWLATVKIPERRTVLRMYTGGRTFEEAHARTVDAITRLVAEERAAASVEPG